MEIPELKIHAYKNGTRKVMLNDYDLSMLISDIKIKVEPGSTIYAVLTVPIVKPNFTYEE